MAPTECDFPAFLLPKGLNQSTNRLKTRCKEPLGCAENGVRLSGPMKDLTAGESMMSEKCDELVFLVQAEERISSIPRREQSCPIHDESL